jgi:hypothetical protein
VDYLHWIIALVPLALYLQWQGLYRFRSKPHVLWGNSDRFALSCAVCGFFFIGPVEMLMPARAAIVYGPYVWLLLLALYFAGTAMVLSLCRPRVVCYNTTLEQLEEALKTITTEREETLQKAGECYSLPELKTTFSTETSRRGGSVLLLSAGGKQSLQGWKILHSRLTEQLKKPTSSEKSAERTWWAPFTVGLMIEFWLVLLLVKNSETIGESLARYLNP